MTVYKENRHSILISCSFSEALCEIIRWGQAPWWPKNSLMCFVRKSAGEVGLGTRYRQKVLLPFAPSWDVEVTDLTDRSITRHFLNGMFTGQESVSLRSRGSEVEVNYEMSYQVNGLLNRIFWPLVFRRLHDNNIEAILANLKKYLEGNIR